MIEKQPCTSHARWTTVMVEMARDGAEAIDLDRCLDCGQYRLSWWWPKDSSDTKLQSERALSAEAACLLMNEHDWNERARLLREIL